MSKTLHQDHDEMLNKIIKQTVDLQSEFVFNMAEKISKVDDKKIEEDLMRKKEITLGN